MNKFPKKSDLLVELRRHGDAYLEDVRADFSDRDRDLSDKYDINRLALNERLRKLGEFVISDMTPIPAKLPHIRAINEPVFHWNGSIEDPVVTNAENPLINSSDCFPPSLTVLASDYVEQGFGEGTTVYDQFVKKVGALFYAEATPRDFQLDASRHDIALHFADHKESPIAEYGHVASGKLLYNTIRDGGLPAFDIHDIAHHASQIGTYGEFYRWLTAHATDEVMVSPDKQRQRRLIRSVLLTSLEHSVVEAEQGAQSFGCLNWQAPKKSVLSKGVSKRDEFNINDYSFGAQDINLWSSVRAIASIYREQIEAEELLGVKLNWMEAMGYGMDKELLSRVKPFCSYDYSDLTFDSARRANLVVPSSPEELFENCRRLVEEEFALNGGA
jgi:hypothetical protein